MSNKQITEAELRKNLHYIFYMRQDESGTFYHQQAADDVIKLFTKYSHSHADRVIGEDELNPNRLTTRIARNSLRAEQRSRNV